VPSRQLAFAVVVDNVSTNRYDIRTIHELEAVSGIRFPGIPEHRYPQVTFNGHDFYVGKSKL
jgi:endonuclease G